MVVWCIGFDLPSFKYYCKRHRLFNFVNKSIPDWYRREGLDGMKKSTMRQKSRSELEAFIRESEALIAQKEKEIEWAKEVISKKAEEIELIDGIYYAKAKGSPEVLLVEVSGYKAVRYVSPSVFSYWGLSEYNFTRRINVRVVGNRFEIRHEGKSWELFLILPHEMNISLNQVSILSEYDRIAIVNRWLKLLNSYPEVKNLFNELIGRVNVYYGLGIGKIEDEQSDIFKFTGVDYYVEYISRFRDNNLLRNQLLAVRNVLYMIRVFDYSRDVGNTRKAIESKIKWYDKKLEERNGEEFSL